VFHDSRREARHLECMSAASPKLQRAAKAFLLRLVTENRVEEAKRVLRELADELECLEAERAAELARRDRDPPN